jgi:hypothetical protein
MIISEAREFTDEGLAVFKGWLDRAEKIGATRWTAEPPPTNILGDERYSRSLGLAGRLAQRKFERKYDLGMAICTGLGKPDAERLLLIPNAWPWLSLFFHESTFPQKGGKWRVGIDSRHIVQTIAGRKQDQSHRHLVKSAVTNVLRFDVFATVLMSDIGQSKIEEQVMSRRDEPPLAHHVEFIKTLHRLYWDADEDDVKKGASSEGAGSIMHMIDLLTQFDLTFDIASLTVDDFMQILPADFQRFLTDEYRTRSRGRRERPSPRPDAAPPPEA